MSTYAKRQGLTLCTSADGARSGSLNHDRLCKWDSPSSAGSLSLARLRKCQSGNICLVTSVRLRDELD